MGKTAGDIMSTTLITVKPDTNIRDLAEILVINRISGVPVVDDNGRLVGVVSQTDLVAQNKNPHIPNAVTLFDWVLYLGAKRLETELAKMAGTTVSDIMTTDVTTVRPGDPLEDVATIMSEQNIHTIPVLADGDLVGVIGRLDIVRSMIQ